MADVKIVNDDLVELRLVNASIEAAAEAVLSDTLGFQYVVSDDVTGEVTVQTTRPIEKSALYNLFQAALDANGARIEKRGDVLAIVRGDSGNRSFRLLGSGGQSEAGILIAPLEFVSTGQMAQLLSPLVNEGLSVTPDRDRNLLLLSGPARQLEAAVDTLNIFDVDVLSGKSIALLTLDSAAPDDVAEELKLIFQSEEGDLLDGVIEFVPNNRLGSVLVITSRAQYLPRAQKWTRELDRSAGRAQRLTEIYPLANRQATELAPIISQMLGGAAPAVSDGEGETTAVSASIAVPDETRNAILVRALRAEHREVAQLIRSLDVAPNQVLIEATIAEVTLNDEVDLGVRWFFESGNFSNTFSDLSGGTVSASFPGFSSVFSTGSAQAVLSALAAVTDVNVITSPTLMVLDDREAVLQIGDQVPVATQTSVASDTPGAPVVTSIDYRDTGVILKVKPQIGANGRVLLEITQEISDVASTSSSGIDSPTIRQRQIETSVVLQDGATLALGGLVRANNTITETKVPGLGDVPIVGNAFRSTTSTRNRSELLILIRPRVARNDVQSQSVSNQWRSRLGGANSIVDGGLGGARHTVSDILQ